LNFIRDSKSKRTVTFDEQIEWKEDTNPADDIEKEELKKKLWENISQLEFEDREIITLKEFEGLSYKEISEALNIPIGTVMSRLYYARKKLAKKLEVFK
jgi:RNA polymerase sigma-70 factor (ECF subfamily)